MTVLQQQLMQSDVGRSQMQTQLNTLRAQRRTGPGVGVDTMSEVSSGELHWSGLSEWIVLSDQKQRVEYRYETRVQCRAPGRNRTPGQQRIVARFAPLAPAQYPRASVGPGCHRRILRRTPSVADYGGALGCQCSVEDCRAVVGIVSLRLIRRRSGEAGDIRERSVAIRHELRRETLSDDMRIWVVMN